VRPLRVLVVDDMAPVRAMMTRILTFSGHTVTEASSAPEAIAAWEAQGGAFDLLLSDIALGSGGNGRQLAATLRERAPELVIVLMSGFAPDQAQPAAGRSYDFLQKPFRMEDLNSLIARRFKR
jgi:DNA-binding NtrC family response regulator